MIWQMTYTHKLPKLCSATLKRQKKIEFISFQARGGSLYLRGLMIGCIFCLEVYGSTAVYGIPPTVPLLML